MSVLEISGGVFEALTNNALASAYLELRFREELPLEGTTCATKATAVSGTPGAYTQEAASMQA